MINPDWVKEKIEAAIPEAQAQIVDLTGGGDHYDAIVISPEFEGKSLVQQHQMVYGALKEAMASNAIHALALKTYTPEAWASKK
ncbi:MAG: BolA family transcriptional regulator [Oscillatoria sp. SIO1A7]|nr:BolA family transcriptional regulator [Oscillatoria sp. SIO1A7]